MVWQLDPAAAAPRERKFVYAAPEPPHQQSYELRRSTPQELVARDQDGGSGFTRARAGGRSLSDSALGKLVTRTEETRGTGRGHWTDFVPPQTQSRPRGCSQGAVAQGAVAQGAAAAAQP